MSRESKLAYYHRHKDQSKKRREQRIADGLCVYCVTGSMAERDRLGCRPCLDRMKAKSRASWAKVKLTKADRRTYLIELKGGKCVDCGYNEHPAAFEFDHLKDKAYAISNMLNNCYKWETILQEVEKCELVCANCHRVRTHNRRKI